MSKTHEQATANHHTTLPQTHAMQQGDYDSSPYYQQYFHFLNPNPSDPLSNPYASAPLFTSTYTSSSSADYSAYHSIYPPFSQNPDPIATPIPTPTAPSYNTSASNPNLNSPSFNSPPQQSSFPPFYSHMPYQSLKQPQSQPPLPPYYPPFDYQQAPPPNYEPPQNPSPNPNLNPNPMYLATSYGQVNSSVPPV